MPAPTPATRRATRLADLLAERGDLDEAVQILRARADAGDGVAAGRLADLLARRGDLDGLRARADAGDVAVAQAGAGRSARRARRPGRVAYARPTPATPGRYAARRLADCSPSTATWTDLRARADAGDEDAAKRLAELLADRGDLDEAEQILRARANAGDEVYRQAAGRPAD